MTSGDIRPFFYTKTSNIMEDWNQVHATVSIDGENRNYTHISLVEKFGQ